MYRVIWHHKIRRRDIQTLATRYSGAELSKLAHISIVNALHRRQVRRYEDVHAASSALQTGATLFPSPISVPKAATLLQ